MSGPERPARVRVTAPPAQRRTTQRRSHDLDQDTRIGAMYLGSLLRAQLWLAARTLAVLTLLVGVLPLLFFIAPSVAGWTVLGLPAAWLVLGGLVYPVLALLGWRFVRAAERNESAFADLIRELDP